MSAEQKGIEGLTLHLTRLEELIVAPDARPLEGRFEERSGVDRIMDQLRAGYTRRLAAVRARLVVDEMPTQETRREVDDALKALARFQDKRHGEQLVTIRRDGLRALGKGVLFMLACMIVSAVAGKTTILPDLIRSLVSEGFVVAGWVALWHPMELLLYEWWPVARDRKLYRLIAAMDLTIEPASGAAVSG